MPNTIRTIVVISELSHSPTAELSDALGRREVFGGIETMIDQSIAGDQSFLSQAKQQHHHHR